jgi:hypothetical protein
MTTEAARPSGGRRRLVWVLVAIGAVLVVGLAVLLTAILSRPGPTSGTGTPAAAPTGPPTPVPSVEPSPADQTQAHAQYRAYVSTVIQSGTSVLASLGGLEACRDGRPACVQQLNDASRQVESMQHDLNANPAPPCLTEADQRLQDSLTFQQKGLDTARAGVVAQNRVQAMQGLLLTAAGVWRASQAIVDGRQANC